MSLSNNVRTPDFVRQVINDESKTAPVLDTIESAIAALGRKLLMIWLASETLTASILLVVELR